MRALIPAITIPLIIIIDQATKFAIKTSMCLHDKIEITSWFQLLFTENEGMAFGMSFVGTMFLALFRIVATALFIYLLYKIVKDKKYPTGLIVVVSMLIAGALGNLIDNFFYGLIFTESLPSFLSTGPAHVVPFGEGYGEFLSGKVVDMFYFPFFEWPDWVPLIGGDVFFGAVFNVADAAISIAFVLALCFYSKYLTFNFKTKGNDSPTNP
jgi:signal peptidase II